MAGTTHYRYEHTNAVNELWKVEIIDTTYAGETYTTVAPDGDGFNLSWEGPQSETYQPIIPATFTCNLKRNSVTRGLLTDIVTESEGTFIVCIYKYNTCTDYYDKMWTGPVMQDDISLPDKADDTADITITATDGFGMLKDIEFTDFDISALTRATVKDWICRALFHIPYTDIYRECIEDYKYVSLASVWYEDSMDSSVVTDANYGNPLMNTLINQSAFITVDDYGVAKGSNYYDILSNILTAFNLHLSQWNGTYLFIQDNIYAQTQTRAWHYDWQNWEFAKTELIDLQATMPTRFAGGQFNFILPVKKVTTEYGFTQGIYPNNLFPADLYEDTTYTCGPFDTGLIVRLIGRLVATLEMVGSGTEANITLEHNITVRNGTLYLHKHATSGMYYWGVGANSLSFTRTVYLEDVTAGDLFTMTNEFDITLPATIGVDDNITFSYSLASCTNSIGDDPTTTDGPSQVNASLVFALGAAPMEGKYLFESSVTNAAAADLELENSILGDGPYSFNSGSIHVINSSDNVVPSNAWTIYSEIGGTAITLNALRCREMLALRRKTVQLYNGSFHGSPDIHKGFVWDGKYWEWLSINWTCSTAEFSGTAMAIVLDRTSITNETPKISTDKEAGTTTGSGTVIPPQSSDLSVEDGIFDLSLLNGVLSVEPYAAKKGSDPGYPYFYNNEGIWPSTYNDVVLTLDGTLFCRDIYFPLEDDPAIIGLSRQSLRLHYSGDIYAEMLTGTNLTLFYKDKTKSYPVLIGNDSASGYFHGEYLLIDDYAQTFKSWFTSSRFGKSDTNYAEFESDGTLVLHGTATAWDDLRIEPVVRSTGPNIPAFEMWRQDGDATSRGVYLYSFTDESVNLKEIHFTMQMPHDWAQTAINIHIHWIGNLDDTTSAPYWGLEYSWAEIGSVFPVTQTVYTDGKNYTGAGVDANITAYKHYISKFTALTPSASQDGISSIMIGRLFRSSASASDTYDVSNNKCGLLYIDAHYERNSLGSHTEYTK